MKKIIILIVLIGAALGGYFFFDSQKPPETAADKSSDFTMTASSLISDFEENVTTAHTKYNNKTIEVSGTISEIELNGENVDVIIKTEDPMSNVNIQLTSSMQNEVSIKVGEAAKLKGIYRGVNDELGIDVELNEGIIIND